MQSKITLQETRRKCAFTLAEALIAIAIIGLVAALILPSVFNRIQEYIFVNKIKDTYSMFTKAYSLAVVENGPANTWNIGQSGSADGATRAYNYFKPYLKISKECGTGSTGNCFANHYKALFNNDFWVQPNTHPNYYKAVLSNGVSIAFWSGGNGNYVCIYADINGKKGPNRAGVDYQQFSCVRNQQMVPSESIIVNTSYGEKCKYNDKSNNNYRCMAWILVKGNMDYLRRDITNDWKKFKGIK